MKSFYHPDCTDRLVQEIKRKELLAEEARRKGMHATYGNYKADIALLQTRLRKMRTAPKRPV